MDDIRTRASVSDQPLPEGLWQFIFEQIKEKAEFVDKIYPIDDVHPREDQIYQPHAADQLNQTFHYLANWLPSSV